MICKMQSEIKTPDLLLRDSETGRWMKVFVQLTQNDDDDCQFESQVKMSSSDICHENGIEPSTYGYDDHCDHRPHHDPTSYDCQ